MLFSFSAFAQPWGKFHDQELMDLRMEVGAELLLQELQLTPEQKSKMLALLAEVQEARGEAEGIVNEFHGTAKEDLRGLLSELKAGKEISKEQMTVMRDEHVEHWTKLSPYKDRIDTAGKAVLDLLTEEQLERMRQFRPMGPGKGPVEFAGLSGTEILDKVREMSDEEFEALKDRRGSDMKGRKGKRGMGPGMKGRRGGRGMGPGMGQNAQPPQGRFLNLMEDVRTMSDDEYQVKKDVMADSIDDRAKRSNGKRGKRGMKKGKKGRGMGPMGSMDKGPHMLRAVILSDHFYEALQAN